MVLTNVIDGVAPSHLTAPLVTKVGPFLEGRRGSSQSKRSSAGKSKESELHVQFSRCPSRSDAVKSLHQLEHTYVKLELLVVRVHHDVKQHYPPEQLEKC